MWDDSLTKNDNSHDQKEAPKFEYKPQFGGCCSSDNTW